MSDRYMKRVIDGYLDRRLRSSGAVLIEGAKCCGKTRTAKEHVASTIYMQDPNFREQYKRMAELKPSELLKGDTPRLIDEWQLAPILWDAVRYEIDDRNGAAGQFILTGSTVVPDDKIMHSGAGRISRILMRPMSLFESSESDGSVSLQNMFGQSREIAGCSEMSLEEISHCIVRGGWPESIGIDETSAVNRTQDYVSAVAHTDMSSVDGVKRDPRLVSDILRSFSRNISTTAAMSTIRDDVFGAGSKITEKTMASYVSALTRLFVIEDVPAWNPAMRSKSAIRASPKRHFVDPSIAATIFHSSSQGLMKDLNTMGLLFESLCVRDLRVYAQAIDGEIYHYRDRTDLEADAIIHLRDGRWAAVEVKLGQDRIDEAARDLLRLKEKVDTDRMQAPSFLMVMTSTGYAYERKDGVHVVPIGCLKD
jgi:predicted AAA+ superfamily ATPase